MTLEGLLFTFAVMAIVALRWVWLAWTIRFRGPLDILNDDLARQRARRQR